MNKEIFSHRIITSLREKKVEPQHQLLVLLKKALVVAGFVLALLAGAAIVATIIFLILDRDQDIFGYFGQTYGEYTLATIPYFWIGFLILIIALVRILQRQINRGYRFGRMLVVMLVSGGVGIAGMLLFFGGLTRGVHDFFYNHVPFYNKLIDSNEVLWQNPQDGLFYGTIVSSTADGFTLRGPKGFLWKVYPSKDTVYGINAEPLVIGKKVKIVGDINKGTYEIRPSVIEQWSNFGN